MTDIDADQFWMMVNDNVDSNESWTEMEVTLLRAANPQIAQRLQFSVQLPWTTAGHTLVLTSVAKETVFHAPHLRMAHDML